MLNRRWYRGQRSWESWPFQWAIPRKARWWQQLNRERERQRIPLRFWDHQVGGTCQAVTPWVATGAQKPWTAQWNRTYRSKQYCSTISTVTIYHFTFINPLVQFLCWNIHFSSLKKNLSENEVSNDKQPSETKVTENNNVIVWNQTIQKFLFHW